MPSYVVSSGHGLHIRGARGNPVPPQLDEVDHARKVTDALGEVLEDMGCDVVTFHDNTSYDVSTNLTTIVNAHNREDRDVDISVHLNCYDHSAHGVEVLYKTQKTLAQKIAQAISKVSGLTLRGDQGAVYRSDLKFLNSTEEPAVLIELGFCDHTGDCEKLVNKFDDIVVAIAEALTGDEADIIPPRPELPPTQRPPEDRPTLSKGDDGPDVVYLQEQLNSDSDAGLEPDGDFGSMTDEAVRTYQRSRNLDDDGIVGPQTWDALETDAPAYVPPGLPEPLSDRDIAQICEIAMNSDIAQYNWEERGMAPPGYIKGFALSFANVYRKLLADHGPAMEMAKRRDGDNEDDVLQVYKDDFEKLGMNNESSGPDTLRHFFALLLGQGMRESSGRHCEGRDMSSDNVTSETAESGLMQTSYNARNLVPYNLFDQLFDEYSAGGVNGNPQGFLNVFADGVYCDSGDWSCYGSGDGLTFQKMCKEQPAFAVESCAVVARNRCDHYGPLTRHEAELKAEAEEMLAAVQNYLDEQGPRVS